MNTEAGRISDINEYGRPEGYQILMNTEAGRIW